MFYMSSILLVMGCDGGTRRGLRLVAVLAVWLCAAVLSAQENHFTLRVGNGGGTGFEGIGPDLSLVYVRDGRFFHGGGGIQYNAGTVTMTGHFLFDLTLRSRYVAGTISAGPLYHVGFPGKTVVTQDIFLCLAPKLVVLPSRTEIRLAGGVGGSAMTLHGVVKSPAAFWDFNTFFGAEVAQSVGIVRLSGAVATCSYFRYDFLLVPQISAGIDVLCTDSLSFGVSAVLQYSEFATNCQNTVLTDVYMQAVVRYAL